MSIQHVRIHVIEFLKFYKWWWILIMLDRNRTLKNDIKLYHSQNFLHSTKLVVDLLKESSKYLGGIIHEII